jgi:hypothetical protein
MTNYDKWIPTAKQLIKGLSAKPGVHFADKTMAADSLAQALCGMFERGEVPNAAPDSKHERKVNTCAQD